jgi:hypothetical protein
VCDPLAGASPEEICGNTADDDCDGQIDEMEVCGTGGELLTVIPSALRVKDIGTTAQLHVFVEEGETRTEVTTDVGTTYRSSNPAVATVDATGLISFWTQGQATLSVVHNGQMEITQVEVDADGMFLIEGEVGPNGGEVMLPNGTGVNIPPDALPRREIIRIEEVPLSNGIVVPSGTALVGPVYNFAPDGLIFNLLVEVSVAYDPAVIPPDFDEETILLEEITLNGDVVPFGPHFPPDFEPGSESGYQAPDLVRKIVVAQTNHFTDITPTALRALPFEDLPLLSDGTKLRVKKRLKTEPVELAHKVRDGTVTHIVLHSTAGPENQEVAGAAVTGLKALTGDPDFSSVKGWAHYYVGRDGTIIQIVEDNIVARHVFDRTVNGVAVNNENSIGIEIVNFNTRPDGDPTETPRSGDPYPGRQISAVVRLVDYLIRKHSLTRPSAATPAGALITHDAQDVPPSAPNRKCDPCGDFRTVIMGSPSLEDIIYQALRQDHGGVIDARGGDSLGPLTGSSDFKGGDGGNVTLAAGITGLVNAPDNTRSSLIVTNDEEISGPLNLMHLIVKEGATLKLTSNASLNVDGIFYVGGTIDATGTLVGPFDPDGENGRSLTIEADGFALIEGKILTKGNNKRTESGGGGDGGIGGNFSFRTAAPGPIWVPTVITRGGDTDANLGSSGGNGGNVEVSAATNTAGDYIDISLQGSPLFDLDTLPPPPPFNQMNQTCGRPAEGQRLPLINPVFSKGILTVGGIGGNGGGLGGSGGNIVINNAAPEKRIFPKQVDLFSGAGNEILCYEIFFQGAPRLYGAPSGGLGGKGLLNGGNGGPGGDAGNISVTGTIQPSVSSLLEEPVFGHNSGTINSFGVEIGKRKTFTSTGGNFFRTNSTGGSGGVPGGSALGFPGFFGPKGMDGVTTIGP